MKQAKLRNAAEFKRLSAAVDSLRHSKLAGDAGMEQTPDGPVQKVVILPYGM
jgi:hypothetical protein